MPKFNFKYLASYSILAVFGLMIFAVGAIIYDSNKPPVETVVNTPKEEVVPETTKETPWRLIYPEVTAMQIGTTTVQASVAESWPDRIKGLSDTPYLPEEVVKFFVFDSPGLHAIWMKDMNYEIDIIWLDEEGKIVHLVEGATPLSYPAMFTPKVEAKYVIETVSGFIAKNNITKNSVVTLPKL